MTPVSLVNSSITGASTTARMMLSTVGSSPPSVYTSRTVSASSSSKKARPRAMNSP